MTSDVCIGLLTPAWPGDNTPNGIATSVYFLAEGLRDIGYTPVIIAMVRDGQGPSDIPVVQVPEGGANLIERLRMRLGDREGWNRPIVRRISAAVKQAQRDHGLNVLISEETQGWAYGVQARTGVPTVVALHGPWLLHKSIQSKGGSHEKEDMLREKREARQFLAAPGMLSPSQNVLEAVSKALDVRHVPAKVIANSISVSTSKPSAELAPPDILFVGRFDRHKGGDTVLEAFAHLTEMHPDARLTFAGPDRGFLDSDGRVWKMPEALAKLPKAVQSQITYFGPASREEVADLRKRHAIALIASRYENLNYTLLEAMAAGHAIVSTDVGGPAEVLQDGETALLVPPEDPVAMAQALARLHKDATLRTYLGRNALETIQTDFSPAEIARQTVDFVQAVMQKSGAY